MDDEELNNLFTAIDSGALSSEHICAIQKKIQRKGRELDAKTFDKHEAHAFQQSDDKEWISFIESKISLL